MAFIVASLVVFVFILFRAMPSVRHCFCSCQLYCFEVEKSSSPHRVKWSQVELSWYRTGENGIRISAHYSETPLQ